jgi:hypothetical protein
MSTMELYNGFNHRFMMKGHEFPLSRRSYKVCVASKLHEILTALFVTATFMQMSVLAAEIGCAEKDLYNSEEMSGAPDEGIIRY